MADDKTGVVKLDTVFLTGPGGRVYELPAAVAEQYLVRPDRISELGHLPIVPYGCQDKLEPPARAAPSRNETYDVEGRHMVFGYDQWSGTYRHYWHFEVLDGTFLGVDGVYYQGPHYHPYQTELGYGR